MVPMRAVPVCLSKQGRAQMSVLNRRGFMKALLATAASTSSARAALSHAATPPIAETETANSLNLENGEQQLRFSSVGEQLTFQNFLRAGKEWKPATLAGIPLVTGPSFPTAALRRQVQFAGLTRPGPDEPAASRR